MNVSRGAYSRSIHGGVLLVLLLLALPPAQAEAGSEATEGILARLWEMRVAGAIFAIFLAMVALMYMKRISALLALPIMAILFGVVAGVPRSEIVTTIVAEGALRLNKTYTVAFFGGMLAIFVKERRIAEAVIKYTAELAGDKPLIVGLALMAVSALLFTTLGGLGAIIMVGTIILPIMLSLGAPAYVAGGIFLIGLCAGGTLSPQAWQFYIDAMGVQQETVQNFAVSVALCYILVGIAFVFIGLRKAQRRNFMAVYPKKKILRKGAVRPLALLTPLVPILLVIRMGQMIQILVDYHGLARPHWITFLSGAGALTLLVLALGGAQKIFPMRKGLGKEALEVARPLAGLIGGGLWLLLIFSAIPISWLRAVQQAGLYWDTHFGAWEFIPAFIAALVYGLVMTWKGFPPRAWITGVALFLAVWLFANLSDLRAILNSERTLGEKVFGLGEMAPGLLTLHHATAVVLGLAAALALSWDKRSVQVLSKALLEGAESVMPAVLLMFGIGMLLMSVAHPKVSGQIEPLLKEVIPTTRWSYIAVFAILAPLALYRGPLNIWGMGIGLAGLMIGMNQLTPAAVMGIFISVGALQGCCDPTNTHNVWIANYLGLEVLELTKKLLPFIWFLTILALTVAGFRFVG